MRFFIYHKIGNKDVLGEQLLELIKKEDYHHMCGMVGLRHLYIALNNASIFEKIDIDPYFFANLKYAKGSYNSVKGEVTDDNIRLIINAPTDNFVYYKGKALDKGENEFII